MGAYGEGVQVSSSCVDVFVPSWSSGSDVAARAPSLPTSTPPQLSDWARSPLLPPVLPPNSTPTPPPPHTPRLIVPALRHRQHTASITSPTFPLGCGGLTVKSSLVPRTCWQTFKTGGVCLWDVEDSKNRKDYFYFGYVLIVVFYPLYYRSDNIVFWKGETVVHWYTTRSSLIHIYIVCWWYMIEKWTWYSDTSSITYLPYLHKG